MAKIVIPVVIPVIPAWPSPQPFLLSIIEHFSHSKIGHLLFLFFLFLPPLSDPHLSLSPTKKIFFTFLLSIRVSVFTFAFVQKNDCVERIALSLFVENKQRRNTTKKGEGGRWLRENTASRLTYIDDERGEGRGIAFVLTGIS